MSELIKEAAKLAAELLGDYLYKSSLTTHQIRDLTHHQLALVFLNNIHNPSVLYAVTRLDVTRAAEAASKFLSVSDCPPERTPDTADGWYVIAAHRRKLTMREQCKFWIGTDLQPHLFLLMLRGNDVETHVFAGCRYTDHSKANFRNWFGKAAAERAYRLLIATLVDPPITTVTAENAAALP
jgi:hypothetical protein